jgi:hypothetical protein
VESRCLSRRSERVWVERDVRRASDVGDDDMANCGGRCYCGRTAISPDTRCPQVRTVFLSVSRFSRKCRDLLGSRTLDWACFTEVDLCR